MTGILLNVLVISALIVIPASSLMLSLKVGKLYPGEFLDNKELIIKYLIAMFIISPALVILFDFIFKDHEIWIAILIISLSPPAYGLAKKLSPHGVSVNLSLLVILCGIVLSLIFIPAAMLVLEKITKINLDLGIDDVLKKILITFIVPVALGFLISGYFEKSIPFILKILDPVVKAAMVVLIVCLLVLGIPLIISKGIVPVLLVLLFQITLLAVTHLISLSEKKLGLIIPYSVILRLPAPAIAISQVNNTIDKHLAVIVMFTFSGIILMAVYNKLFFRKN